MRVLIMATILAVLAQEASAESITKSFYDKSGSFAGSSVQRNNQSSYYDRSGRFDGSSVQHGNSTSYYDHAGRYSGSTINTGPRR
jgi:hypothetical protein